MLDLTIELGGHRLGIGGTNNMTFDGPVELAWKWWLLSGTTSLIRNGKVLMTESMNRSAWQGF